MIIDLIDSDLFQAGGVASQLFSTAVISGSKSLPNLVADDKCHSKYLHIVIILQSMVSITDVHSESE